MVNTYQVPGVFIYLVSQLLSYLDEETEAQGGEFPSLRSHSGGTEPGFELCSLTTVPVASYMKGAWLKVYLSFSLLRAPHLPRVGTSPPFLTLPPLSSSLGPPSQLLLPRVGTVYVCVFPHWTRDQACVPEDPWSLVCCWE